MYRLQLTKFALEMLSSWTRAPRYRQARCTLVLGKSILLFPNHRFIVADGILIECTELKVDESSLSGESVPVNKNCETKPFMLSGCSVVEGDARYLVTAVGRNSEWGKILSELDTDRPDTPLQVVCGGGC